MSVTGTAEALDTQISSVFGLISLLLVFLIGYFSALWPRVDDWRGKPPPDVGADRVALGIQLKGFAKQFLALDVLVILVLTLLGPISRQAILQWGSGGGFPTIRAGLLFVDVLLLLVGSFAGVQAFRLRERAKVVTDAPPAQEGH